ncbi:MAG: DUF4065 domain-containing protein [Candidatus Aenigmarchaeota archaeon]|nr:DUF4065 domain-containing protein [Candidatus Aenigmarchaeota archaeon]MDW8149763.1 DUF4065 domain-containing protein [Candidatus Aenigmarchaeota archaeon]
MNSRHIIGKKIKQLREKFNLTQDALAKKLGISRPSISQIESGERDISSTELVKLSEIFEVPIEELLTSKKKVEKEIIKLKQKSKLPPFNKDRFKQVLLYILEKCGARPNVGKTVLYKLLYFCDFDHYELYEEPLTGATYRKISYGPAPCEFEKTVEEMKRQKQVQEITTEYYGQLQTKYIPLVEPDLTKLTAAQKEVIDKVIEKLSFLDAKAISDYSHEDIPWKAAKEKEIIDYELVFYRTPSYSVRSYFEE